MKSATLDMFALTVAPKTQDSNNQAPGDGRALSQQRASAGESTGGVKGAGVPSAQVQAAAPAPNAPDVKICRVTLGITTYVWLCADCRKARQADGWSIDIVPAKIGRLELTCDDHDRRGEKLK